ncbi:hypothetical protein A2Y85_06150 [candidate division WOR-3 bacterium RBG_13_43_14]|uniref:Fis family transcriptional regulator n=1 Tax=candidate division WOR-3 bacterium RBG_13_43_14 TaxID=1802590 RepID=A0A1F4UA36_UNCW3|nr:MAG: hypothetical protein A2Y85_06150 [candidate division WOR-3 bacterium RBG_13_43_14]
MIEKGKVIKVAGDIAEISIVPGDACRSCPACGSCRLNEGLRVISAYNLIKAQPGDLVKIEVAEKGGLRAAFIIFGIPIVLAITGLIISAGLIEIYRILITVGGLIMGLIIAKIIDRTVKTKRNFMPNVIDKES